MRRYKIRLHESGNRDGSVAEGTLVLHLGGGAAFQATSIEEAENRLRNQLANGELQRGRIYQICPPAESAESLLTLAAALDGELKKCQLERGQGLYSEFQRVRDEDSDYTARYASERSSHRREAVPTLV